MTDILEKNHLIGIVFDIDDTLYLERDYVKSGFDAVGKAIGCTGFGDTCWEYFLEGVRNNTFNLALEKFPELQVSVSELVDIYRNHRPNISLCDDARECLYRLHHCRTAFVSDGPVVSQRAKCNALNLLPWIDYPLFTSEINISKPAEGPFQLTAWTLNLPYNRCVYIADNPKKDFIGPHRLGYKTIRIRRPGALHYDVPSGDDVDMEIESLNELL